ncbi:MAG: DUF2625 domain-containing protein [Blastocatellia bacterium]
MRTLDQLLETDDPAWPLAQQWIRVATNQIEVLPASDARRSDALVATQVTTRSPLGAIIYETGGILVDNGWIRILGSGHPRLPRSLPDWNLGRTTAKIGEYPTFILVADDVLGGFFAINGGALGEDRGNVCYFAPDTLEWESLEKGYTEFIVFCLNGDLQRYYEGYRWNAWETEVSALAGDKAFSIYPPLWAKGPDISERGRRPVPLTELYSLYVGEFQTNESRRSEL